jgi:hypothetical protein
MGGVFEALLAVIGFGVLVLAAWAALFADEGHPMRELREVRRTAENEMRRAVDNVRGRAR